MIETAPTKPALLLLRSCSEHDLPAVTAIYGHHVGHGTASFELEPPDLAEMHRRLADVQAKGWPWLVAERAGQVLGYAYASHFRPRQAYRFCLENSVYVRPEAQGGGIGRALMAELLARCAALGARQMLAVIGDSANRASIGLHAALGFRPIGTMQAVGWKFERWLDVVLMQRTLGIGASGAAKDRQ